MAFNLGTAIGYLDLDTSKFNRGFKSAISDLKVFQDDTATASDKFAAVGSALKSTGSTLTKTVTLPLVGVGTAAVTVASNFESSMSRVQAISGATGEDFEALKNKAQEMGAKTKFSASESADALTYMAMAGWKTDDMLSGLEGIMNLAAASGEDLATTSDIVTDALTAFGLTAADSASFADVLAAASSNANTNVSLMGETFKYAAPVAGALGYSYKDVAEQIGLMANAGIKGSQAGTSLRTMLTSLQGELRIVNDDMEEMIIQTSNEDGSMRNLNDIISDLRTAFSGLSESTAASAAETLVGKEAMSGFLAIMNAAPNDIDKLRSSIQEADGTALSMAGTMQDNLNGQLTILKSTLEGVAISFGELLLPLISGFVDLLQKLLSWVNGLSDGWKQFIVTAAGILAVLGPVLLIISSLIGFVTKLVSVFKILSVAFAAGKAVIVAIATAFGPIGLIIAGVIAAVVALKVAWDNNLGGIQEKTQAFITSCKEIGSKIIDSLLGGLSAAWDKVTEWASKAASWLKDIFSVEISPEVRNDPRMRGSYASGLDYVPRDMLVRVHEGESIRTKQQTSYDHMKSTVQRVQQPAIIQLMADSRMLGQVVIDDINSLAASQGGTPLKI